VMLFPGAIAGALAQLWAAYRSTWGG